MIGPLAPLEEVIAGEPTVAALLPRAPRPAAAAPSPVPAALLRAAAGGALLLLVLLALERTR